METRRPGSLDPGLLRSVRLLRSYCNRERQTAHLEKLRAQAGTERILRPESPAPVGRPAPKRLSAKVNAGILADYAAEIPIRAIARKYGINEWTVHHRLKQAGVVKRPYAMGSVDIAHTLALRAKGLSYDRIADQVGFSASTIRNVVKRRGAY